MKDQLRTGAKKILASPAWKATSEWIRGGKRGPAAGHEIADTPVPGDVVVYFGDPASKIYQIEQWLPVLEILHQRHRVVLVFRKLGALRAVKGKTSLPKIFVRRFDDLATLYFENRYKLAIYVNNGVSNFQSLSYAPMVHVHVNHGESDKLSMVSNQAKAYDRVFIAGEAARQRHAKALLDFDDSKLVEVGRPQLDIRRTPSISPSSLRTLMYAPTWEGENDSNNYTSVDLFGPAIVRALLAVPNSRVIYKPHPRIEESPDERMRTANEQILELISGARERGGEHEVLMQGDILGMFDEVDLMVTDISSVGLDFLYLHPDKPLVLTDRRSDRAALQSESPIAAAAPIIDQPDESAIADALLSTLEHDPFAEERARLRAFYFGDGEVGSSTQAFLDAVDSLISERTEALETFGEYRTAAEANAGDE